MTALVALGALIFAALQVGEARNARTQARRLDVARAQPNVVMYMEVSAGNGHVVDLVIRNFGQTAAFDVRMIFDPIPRRAAPLIDDVVRLPDVIPFLAPGQELRTMWDMTPDRKASALPARYQAEVRYTGIDNAPLSAKSVLDWNTFMGRQWAEVRTTHHVAGSLENIAKSMAKWHDSIGGSLSVVVRDGAALDSAKKAEHDRHFGIVHREQTPRKSRRGTLGV